MIVAGLVAGLVAASIILAASCAAWVLATRKVTGYLRAWVDSDNPETPSQLAALVSSISRVLAQHIAASIKSTFLGVQSVQARNLQRLEGDVLADTNPVLGAIMASFPSVGKRLSKNPALQDMAMALLSKMSSGRPGTGGGGNGSSGQQVKFNL